MSAAPWELESEPQGGLPSRGHMISVAGAQGGAGATTVGLLLAHAHVRDSDTPAIVIDLAGSSRGGLALLGGAGTRLPTEGIAACSAIHGRSVPEPFAVNGEGVRILGAMPDVADQLERAHESVVAELAAELAAGADDTALGAVTRRALADCRCWEAVRWDNREGAEAIATVLDSATEHHGLVVVDVGRLESEAIANEVAARTSLHVWTVPGRRDSLELAQRRLPMLDFSPAAEEVIAIWHSGQPAPSAVRLGQLGATRGATVVRFPNHGGADTGWLQRVTDAGVGLQKLRERLPVLNDN